MDQQLAGVTDLDELRALEASWGLAISPTTADPTPGASPAVAARPGLGRCLRRLGGLDEARLTLTDGYYYATQIALVLFVGAMAAISLSTALSMTLGGGVVGWPLVFGIALGVLVTINDLALVMPDPHRRASWASSVGRLAFSVVFGALIALPLTAVIFARDVDHAQTVARQHETEQAAADFEAQRPDRERAVQDQHRPAVEAATAERDTARADLDAAQHGADEQRRVCAAEITGTGGSGQAGEGPRSSALCASASELQDQLADTRARVDRAETALRTAVDGQRAALDQALASSPVIAPYDPAELGVVDRIEATHRLLGAWSWVIAGALILLDLLPVVRHLTSGERPYEAALRSAGATAEPSASRTVVPSRSSAVDGAEIEETLEDWLRRRLAEDPRPTVAQLEREARTDERYSGSQRTFYRLANRQYLNLADT